MLIIVVLFVVRQCYFYNLYFGIKHNQEAILVFVFCLDPQDALYSPIWVYISKSDCFIPQFAQIYSYFNTLNDVFEIPIYLRLLYFYCRKSGSFALQMSLIEVSFTMKCRIYSFCFITLTPSKFGIRFSLPTNK